LGKNLNNFAKFYRYYLDEHSNPINRRFHFIGNLAVITVLVYALLSLNYYALILAPVFGYGFSWIGHFFIEKNKPATFNSPIYSIIADWVMFKDVLTGKIKL